MFQPMSAKLDLSQHFERNAEPNPSTASAFFPLDASLKQHRSHSELIKTHFSRQYSSNVSMTLRMRYKPTERRASFISLGVLSDQPSQDDPKSDR